MQPLGRKPSRFPGKINCHPKKPFINWWEVEISTDNKKKTQRQESKKALKSFILLLLALLFAGCSISPAHKLPSYRMSDGPEITNGDQWGGIVNSAMVPICSGTHVFTLRFYGPDVLLTIEPIEPIDIENQSTKNYSTFDDANNQQLQR